MVRLFCIFNYCMLIIRRNIFLLIYGVLFTCCDVHKTFILTDKGKIKRNYTNEVKYEPSNGFYVMDYYINYNKNVSDTVELKKIIDKFIIVLKKRKLTYTKHLNHYSIAMKTDTTGYLKMKTKYRDYSAHFEFNLKSAQMHYLTTAGF